MFKDPLEILLICAFLYVAIGIFLGYRVAREACQMGCFEANSGIIGGCTVVLWWVMYPFWKLVLKKKIKRELEEESES